MSSVFILKLYLPAAALLFVFTLAIVAKFQPYKNKRNNTVDIIILFVTISGLCIILEVLCTQSGSVGSLLLYLSYSFVVTWQFLS